MIRVRRKALLPRPPDPPEGMMYLQGVLTPIFWVEEWSRMRMDDWDSTSRTYKRHWVREQGQLPGDHPHLAI